MEVRYQLRYSPVNRIYVPPETRDSIPAASTSSHQPSRPGQQACDSSSQQPTTTQAAGAGVSLVSYQATLPAQVDSPQRGIIATSGTCRGPPNRESRHPAL